MNKKLAIFVSSSLVLVLFAFPFFVQKAEALSPISSSLDIGSTGADVSTLQTFLAQDTSIYLQGLVTGYFGSLTSAAVKNFQNKYGISAVGRVGPQTMAKINELIANGGFGNGSMGGTTSMGPGQAPAISSVATSLSTQNTGTTTVNGAVVSWQTDRPTTGKVFYSATPIIASEPDSPTVQPTIGGNVVSDNTITNSHSVTLTNLWTSGNTSPYYYMVEAVDANGYVSVTWPTLLNSSGVSTAQ